MKKTCSICKEEKNSTDFHKRKDRISGTKSECKVCKRIKDKNKYTQDPVKQKEYGKTLKGRYSKYKTTAKSFDREFNISLDEFSTFWNKPCEYCKDPIDGIGLDRINSDLGYTIDNVVPCCLICNKMKMNYSNDFWFAHMRKILEIK